jgi:hypothetical protein
MAYNVVELTTFLANLASGRRRDGSCARPGATTRVVALDLLSDCRPYTNSRAWLTEDRRLRSGGRGDVLSTWVPTVRGMALHAMPGMAAQRQGWLHRAGGDGEDVVCRPCVTASSKAGWSRWL